ncbi:MAG TPA: inorganic diphosphatase [Mucilaginibacter sp.]|jgi:inorganic pyrophosphatase|nr:inorganic diphosphatase [Mucilaginibacter sp.]
MKPVTAIIESPNGCNHKYDYEPDIDSFKLEKLLPAGLVFPYDFGFIPDTKGDDGDPLDIIVISEITSFPGCSMDCRIIGGFTAEQTQKSGKSVRNDRFLSVLDISEVYKDVNEIDDLPEGIMKQIENFFVNYNKQAGKKFKILENIDAAQAYKMIKKQKSHHKKSA